MKKTFQSALNTAFVIVLAAALALTAGCSEDAENNPNDPIVVEESLDGTYEGNDTYSVDLIVDDFSDPNSTPAEGTCVGDISVTVDEDGVIEVVGSGNCATAANAASYSLEGQVSADGVAQGTMIIAFSGRDHEVAWQGTFDDGVLTVTFAGRTPQVGNIEIDWDGDFTATLVE